MSKSVKDKAHVDYIKSILKKIKEDESPAELNELRRTLRKHVPLHLRAYFLAYLLKEALKTGGGTTGSLTTLFVSIGRNRKVFPKDLGRLFSEKLSLRPGEMGNIKILDNYSFVEIAESSAQEAIDKLNNTEFRGRKIAVNFARKKGDNRA